MLLKFKSFFQHYVFWPIFIFLHRLVRFLGNRFLDKKTVNPRIFSNRILREYAPHFSGRIINVSGWDDRDREGKYYRDYFTQREEYVVSNAAIGKKGFGSMEETGIKEIEIDLMKDPAEELLEKFDVVFNHTTLEHIPNPRLALKNLCRLSRDAIIVVVPVIQNFHIAQSYGDYWRPTPLALARELKENGFEPIVISTNDQPFAPIYCFAIAVKDPARYQSLFNPRLEYNFGTHLYGTGVKTEYIENLLNIHG